MLASRTVLEHVLLWVQSSQYFAQIGQSFGKKGNIRNSKGHLSLLRTSPWPPPHFDTSLSQSLNSPILGYARKALKIRLRTNPSLRQTSRVVKLVAIVNIQVLLFHVSFFGLFKNKSRLRSLILTGLSKWRICGGRKGGLRSGRKWKIWEVRDWRSDVSKWGVLINILISN